MFTPSQIRAARAMLGWSAQDLADHANVHVTTVQRMENHDGPARGTVTTLEKIMCALETEGVEFISDKGWKGVRLREVEQDGEAN